MNYSLRNLFRYSLSLSLISVSTSSPSLSTSSSSPSPASQKNTPTNRAHSDNNVDKKNSKKLSSRIIFLGSGSSMGNPMAIYLMQDPPNDSDYYAKNCEISRKAAIGDPRENRNYRCNPSVLIQYNHDTNEETNIVIDAGKTFRESIIRWFPMYKVKSVDAVILTHGHADAIFGLDDIRSVQSIRSNISMPVYLTQECEQVVRKVFFYLFPDPNPNSDYIPRFVSNINWINYFYHQTFHISTLTVIPFPVMHGEDMKSSGFIIGNRSKLCYISDISRMIPSSLQLIQSHNQNSSSSGSSGSSIDLLVIDALAISYDHPTHYSLQQAVDLCREIKPRKCLLVGMGSEMEYEEVNTLLLKYLEKEGLDIQLAHDGLVVDIDL